MKLATTTPAFTLDPTLPWLSTDPTMQEPAAFRNMETVTLNDATWEPMGLYFPGGTQLAMRRVTSLDQLAEGAAYWSENDYYEPSKQKVVTSKAFGRYLRPAFDTASSVRRWKRGMAHIELEADTLDCNLRDYFLREDGTKTVYVDTTANTFRLYQITHYVSLPAPLLAQLGPAAEKQSGLTMRQATWLRQEKELLSDAIEITTHAEGGLGLPDYRVVINRQRARDFLSLQESLPMLTPGQARKCASGTIAITYRSRPQLNARDFTLVEHYKQVDAAPLLDWLRHHSEAQRLQLEAAISQQAIERAADMNRAKKAAEQQKQEVEAAIQKIQEAEQHTAPLTRPHYAGLQELALAA